MSALMKLAIKVIDRRVAAGEDLEAVLLDYHKLTDVEKDIIREELSK